MDKLFVIKVGGNIIDNEAKLKSFLQSFASIQSYRILVHGGGKIATEIGNKLGIESKYINGRRITDDATIDLVTMVYGGLINKKMVAQLQALNCNAIGLTGADGNLIPATKRVVKDIDFGWAGDLDSTKFDVESLKLLLDNGLTPVFAPLTHDEQGHILNTNADTIASSLAVALSAYYDVRLIYCFEKKGVLENVEDENSVIPEINPASYKKLKENQTIFAGMIPKLDNAFAALQKGVNKVIIGKAEELNQLINGEAGTTINHE